MHPIAAPGYGRLPANSVMARSRAKRGDVAIPERLMPEGSRRLGVASSAFGLLAMTAFLSLLHRPNRPWH
jgi:hypothetical protein